MAETTTEEKAEDQASGQAARQDDAAEASSSSSSSAEAPKTRDRRSGIDRRRHTIVPGENLDPRELLKQYEKDELHRMLRLMLLGRRFEEKSAESYALGKIGGFCHLYIGQEAVGIGAIAPLRAEDYVITAYRDHVQALAKGISSRSVMAELYGRADGCSGGKGGSMHMYSREHNFMGGWGIVGGQIPMATGLGFAIRYRKQDNVCLCFFGEAAVNQGAFHESLNMAALWKLPVVFIVENNRFGMGTAWERVASLYDISQKAAAYDMPSAVADGMDVLKMRQVIQEAIDRAREDGTPTLVEARCYRFMGHSMSDPVHGVYRSKEEVEVEKEKDPIRVLIDQLQEADLLSEDELNAMDEQIREEVDDAAEFAENSPEPEPAALYSNVYRQINDSGQLFFDDV